MKWSESESRSVASDSLWPHGLYSLWNSPGYNTGVDSLSLLQQTSPPRNQTRVFCIAGGFFANWAVREAKCRKVIGKLSQVRKTQGIEHMEALCRKLWIGRWWNSSKQCVCENRSIISDSLWPYGLYSPWNSPGQTTGVGSRSLPQGIFPTQGSNPDLPHCRQILYQLSHQGSLHKNLKNI